MSLLALFISVFVQLQSDGSAVFTENWDIDVTEGTEMYLVRDNLGDIEIADYQVFDNGEPMLFLDDWDSGLPREEKSGRYGVVSKKNGCELCWGVGEYGHHNFTVKYLMTNAVKGLNDYDMLHMQLVNPGLSPIPDSIDVEISAPEPLTEYNTRLWGFGYEGNVSLSSDGTARFVPTEFGRHSSVIVLLRFEKHIFSPTSIRNRNFEDVLEEALEGSSFQDDSDDLAGGLFALFFVLFGIGFMWLVKFGRRLNQRRILGMTYKDVEWCREIPFEGDILQSNHVLSSLGMTDKGSVAAAFILRMIGNGQLIASKDERDNIELSFNDSTDLSSLSESESQLYSMMREASGSDMILQKNEFSRWSKRHLRTISKWVDRVEEEGRQRAGQAGTVSRGRFTPEGQTRARKMVGFRKYLDDFTLLSERSSREAVLWKEYLVFAALFGISEKVMKELKEIDPEKFREIMNYDYGTVYQTIYISRTLGSAITNASNLEKAGRSRGGFGGTASFGGGGGFSGGGFGGGVR